MFKINSLCFFLGFCLYVITKGDDAQRDSNNPFSSTYQLWSPIENLPDKTKVSPMFISSKHQIDLVVAEPNAPLRWYANVRGIGKNFSSLPLSSQITTDFVSLNYESPNASDIVYIDQSKKKIILAKNPLIAKLRIMPEPVSDREHEHEHEHSDNVLNNTWEEKIIFGLATLPDLSLNLEPGWTQTYFISSMLKVDSKPNTTDFETFYISLEDIHRQKNTIILALNRTKDGSSYVVVQAFSLDSANPIKIVTNTDLYNEDALDIILLIKGQLHVLVRKSDATRKAVKKLSDLQFPDSYNFKHIHWATLGGTNFKSIFLLNPQTHKLGVLVNSWKTEDKKSDDPWKFMELIHYSLQISAETESDPNDCIVLFPHETEKIYDFLCITDTDLRYYVQDQAIQNISLPDNSTVQMNVYHDMPLHSIVWNTTIKHDQIFYLENTRTSAFILYSNSQGTVSWVEKNKIELDSVAWTTNFWILIMIYCLLMSIIAGIIHTVLQNHVRYSRNDKLLSRLSNAASMNPAALANDINFGIGPNRRTTV